MTGPQLELIWVLLFTAVLIPPAVAFVALVGFLVRDSIRILKEDS